jgi:ribonuclease T
MKEIYISVDIEASGPIPGKYSMLSLGACLVENTKETFYLEFKPINNAFIPEAIQVTNRSIEDFEKTGLEPIKGIHQFEKWIAQVSKNDTPVFVGFNACFDWSFINWYFHSFIGHNPFGISGIDIKAYYMGMNKCPWEETKSSKINPRFKGKTKHTHNALDDAIEQAEMFELMIKYSTK